MSLLEHGASVAEQDRYCINREVDFSMIVSVFETSLRREKLHKPLVPPNARPTQPTADGRVGECCHLLDMEFEKAYKYLLRATLLPTLLYMRKTSTRSVWFCYL